MDKKIVFPVLAALLLTVGCKEKKVSDDIIAPKVENQAPSGPVRMQPYSDSRDVLWLGRNYKVEVNRAANDSLPTVTDESGQKFVDNAISLTIRRADGSVAISKRFTKAAFEQYLDRKFWKEGILEGLVFDKVEGQQLEFAASVCLPQTDEYIPLVVKIDNMGSITIKRDTELDTHGEATENNNNDNVDEEGV